MFQSQWLIPCLSFVSAAAQCGFVTKGSIYFDSVEIEKMVIAVLFHDIISKKKAIMVFPLKTEYRLRVLIKTCQPPFP